MTPPIQPIINETRVTETAKCILVRKILNPLKYELYSHNYRYQILDVIFHWIECVTLMFSKCRRCLANVVDV